MKKTTRRSFLQSALAGSVLGQGIFLTFTKDLFAKTTGDPIIIGHQTDLTGAISSWGYWMDKAADAACKYINDHDGIAGRPVTYVREDTETNPPTGARKFRSLVQRSKADFVIGSVWSGVDLATVPIAKELKTLYVPNGMAAEMTGSKGNRYVFRVNSDTYSQAAAGARWAMENLGKNWTFIFADYAWGWSHFKEHKAVLEKLGATVNEPIAVPLDAKDMLPYLAKVSDKTEQLYSIFSGSQAVAYYTQSKSMGLDKRMHRYSVICTHEAFSPADLGGASEGIYLLEYCPRMLASKDTPNLRKFREILGVDPVDGREEGSNRVIAGSHYWATWETVFFIKKAVEKSGWKRKKDTPEVIKALEGLEVKESIEHPQGDKYIRAEDHKTVINFNMSQIDNGLIKFRHSIPSKDVVTRFPARYAFNNQPF